ncbi:MAG TPA: SDR family NAD(P)-dependent oxidoreductase, partial [Acidimicrobiales bacterium]|nr:SDR family NAD(P)-dependent oxidoreductase [Acidimicrobiales bacterium]
MFAERYLEGRRALVTASSRNLGAAIAAALAARGATVCVQYHASEDAAAALVRDLEATTGRGHTAVGGDVSDP